MTSPLSASLVSCSSTTPLLVDDAPDLRLVVRHTLERHGGFAVVGEAGDGEEAVGVAASSSPDIILLDLDMPGVGGMVALPQLRAVVPNSKIVILSGVARLPAERLARSAGEVGFIEKGISSRRLIDEILAIAGLIESIEGALAESRAVLPGETQSPRAARRFVTETMQRWDCGDVYEVIELLVSELVTNAITHASSDAEVAVILHRDVIRVEVADTSTTPPQLREASPEDASGRGLALVEQLSSAWGIDISGTGKVIWFEVPRLDSQYAQTIIR